MTNTVSLSGYASLTGVSYNVGGSNGYDETIARSAFKRTLGEGPDVQLLINHSGIALARTKAGTLRLAEDDRGLHVDADLDPERNDVGDLLRAMHAGALDQMSFCFQATDQEWSEDFKRRTIKAVSLHHGDVSIVNQGASPSTFARVGSGTPDLASRRRTAESVGRNVRGELAFTMRPGEKRSGLLVIELAPCPERRVAITSVHKPCTRCAKRGMITLKGRRVPCPNCRGRGALSPAATLTSVDSPMMSTSADGSSRKAQKGGAGRTYRRCPRCNGKGRTPTAGGGKSRCKVCAGSGYTPTGEFDSSKVLDPQGLGLDGGRSRIAYTAEALLGIERRAKYAVAELEALGLKGKAFKDPTDGHWSYPIDDYEDLQNAIRAVGRSGASHDKVRAYIAGRARAMGHSKDIPESWNSDGTLNSGRSFK